MSDGCKPCAHCDHLAILLSLNQTVQACTTFDKASGEHPQSFKMQPSGVYIYICTIIHIYNINMYIHIYIYIHVDIKIHKYTNVLCTGIIERICNQTILSRHLCASKPEEMAKALQQTQNDCFPVPGAFMRERLHELSHL